MTQPQDQVEDEGQDQEGSVGPIRSGEHADDTAADAAAGHGTDDAATTPASPETGSSAGQVVQERAAAQRSSTTEVLRGNDRMAEIAKRRERALQMEQAALSGAPQPHELAPDEEPFERGQWNRYARYQCRYCPWDTLHEDAAWAHYSERHLTDRSLEFEEE